MFLVLIASNEIAYALKMYKCSCDGANDFEMDNKPTLKATTYSNYLWFGYLPWQQTLCIPFCIQLHYIYGHVMDC